MLADLWRVEPVGLNILSITASKLFDSTVPGLWVLPYTIPFPIATDQNRRADFVDFVQIPEHRGELTQTEINNGDEKRINENAAS
jgi:hypothetical protein